MLGVKWIWVGTEPCGNVKKPHRQMFWFEQENSTNRILTHITGPIGVVPIWLVALIAVILACFLTGFIYLLWRRHRGHPVDPEIGTSRFRESGNWRNRLSRVSIRGETGLFRAGTMLGGGLDKNTGKEGKKSKLDGLRVDVERGSGFTARDSLSRTKSKRGRSVERSQSTRQPSARAKSVDKSQKSPKSPTSPHIQQLKQSQSEYTRPSSESFDPNQVLSMMKAGGHGDLGLGSGFSDIPLGSVVAVEEEADPNYAPLSRSGTVRSAVARSKSIKRAASRRRAGDDNDQETLVGNMSKSGSYPSSPLSPASPMEMTIPPAAYELDRRRQSPSRTRSTACRKVDDSPDEYEEKERSRCRASRSRTRRESSRVRKPIESDEHDSDKESPPARNMTRHKSTRESGRDRASSRERGKESDRDLLHRDVTRHRSARDGKPGGRESSVPPSRARATSVEPSKDREREQARSRDRTEVPARRSKSTSKPHLPEPRGRNRSRSRSRALEEEDVPLASVALQALQQNLNSKENRRAGRESTRKGRGRPMSGGGTEILIIE